MTGKTNIELEEAFLFDRSLIVCHNTGKTGMFGMEDEYSFWIRFPMNKLKVGLISVLICNSIKFSVRLRIQTHRASTLLCRFLRRLPRKISPQPRAPWTQP